MGFAPSLAPKPISAGCRPTCGASTTCSCPTITTCTPTGSGSA